MGDLFLSGLNDMDGTDRRYHTQGDDMSAFEDLLAEGKTCVRAGDLQGLYRTVKLKRNVRQGNGKSAAGLFEITFL